MIIIEPYFPKPFCPKHVAFTSVSGRRPGTLTAQHPDMFQEQATSFCAPNPLSPKLLGFVKETCLNTECPGTNCSSRPWHAGELGAPSSGA